MSRRNSKIDYYSDIAKTKKGSKFPCCCITIVLLVLSFFFVSVLHDSEMLSENMLLSICVFLILAIIILIFLLKNTRKKVRFIIGLILATILSVILVSGTYIIYEAIDAMRNVTDASGEETYVGVYVLAEDKAENLSDIIDYDIGILSSLDREDTDEAVTVIEDALDTALTISEYSSPTNLIDALYDQSSGAIILNNAFIDMIEEIEGYEDVEEHIREVGEVVIGGKIEEEKEETAYYEGSYNDIGTFSVYLSGIDSRNGLIAKSRSDVNIIAFVNAESKQVLLLSTPRDYFIPLSISNGQEDKLTHAGIYGIDVSMDTLGMLYDIDIDYYFKIDFTGFMNIIDVLGGITVYSDYAFVTSHGEYEYVEGYNDLNGQEALSFARERYAFPDGDIQRGKNQLAIIDAVIAKVMSPSILTNYLELTESISDSFDTNIPYSLLAALINNQLNANDSWNIVSYTVNGTDGHEIPYSMSSYAYVMIPDYDTVDTAKELIESLYAGERISEPDEIEENAAEKEETIGETSETTNTTGTESMTGAAHETTESDEPKIVYTHHG